MELATTGREAVGDEVEVTIYTGRDYSLKQMTQAANEFEALGIFSIELPLLPEHTESFRRLCDTKSLGITTSGQGEGRWIFRGLMCEADLDVIQPDISRLGEVTECKIIDYVDHEANHVCVPHVFRTRILISVYLQLTAAIPNSAFLRFSVTESALRRGLLTTLFKLVNSGVPS